MKYKLDLEDSTTRNGVKLFRIVALTSFLSVNVGDRGGYIEKENNLSQSGNAWVSDDAEVLWISKVGSSKGTLTVFKTKDGYKLTRGCFLGTMEEFKNEVSKKSDSDESKKEYELLMSFIEYKFNKFI